MGKGASKSTSIRVGLSLGFDLLGSLAAIDQWVDDVEEEEEGDEEEVIDEDDGEEGADIDRWEGDKGAGWVTTEGGDSRGSSGGRRGELAVKGEESGDRRTGLALSARSAVSLTPQSSRGPGRIASGNASISTLVRTRPWSGGSGAASSRSGVSNDRYIHSTHLHN